MIELRNIAFAYDNSETIISNFDLKIEQGSILALIGNSGSGKSTILNLIANILTPIEGTISGVTDLAYLTQDVTLLPYLNVSENSLLSIELRNQKNQHKVNQADEWLEIAGLEKRSKTKFPIELSGGMKQRVALVQTILVDSNLYLLDEPFNAIDRNNLKTIQDNIWVKLKEKNASAIIVTHDIEQVINFADQIQSMNKNSSKYLPIFNYDESFKSIHPSKRSNSPLYDQYLLETLKLLS